MTDQFQQIAIQVELARCDQIDNGNRDLLLEQRRALGDEGLPMLLPVLVSGTHQLHDGQQAHAPALVVDTDLKNVLGGELKFQGLHGLGVVGVVRAQKKSGPWGFVGANVRADATSLNAILDRGKMPVIPTLAMGENSLLNVNGDETAAAVAVALECSELLFLTDVEGVKDAAGAVIERSNNPNELLAASFVSGGMIPKLKAVKAAMEGGVGLVRVGRTIFEGAA